MILARDKHLQTGIAGSLVIHALLLLLLAWFLSTQAGRDLLARQETPKEKVPEVTLIFPDQLLPEPPPPVPKKQQAYIRTTQNEAAGIKPTNAPFQSDRNTIAASQKPAVSGSTLPLPSLDGDAPRHGELANRDLKDGKIGNYSAPKAMVAQPSTPPTILKQQPPLPTPQIQTANSKATPTPLKQMMEEMDEETARKDKNRLPIEVHKAAPHTPDTPPVLPSVAKPQVRLPEDTPPPIVKAIPVDEPVMRNTPDPENDTMSPFTRTKKTDGSISKEGPDAVDAEATLQGIYRRQVRGVIEKKWTLYQLLGKDAMIPGSVKVGFYLDRKGIPQDLRVLSSGADADPRTRDLILNLVLDAKIPPPPPDLLSTFENRRMPMEYEFIIY